MAAGHNVDVIPHNPSLYEYLTVEPLTAAFGWDLAFDDWDDIEDAYVGDPDPVTVGLWSRDTEKGEADIRVLMEYFLMSESSRGLQKGAVISDEWHEKTDFAVIAAALTLTTGGSMIALTATIDDEEDQKFLGRGKLCGKVALGGAHHANRLVPHTTFTEEDIMSLLRYVFNNEEERTKELTDRFGLGTCIQAKKSLTLGGCMILFQPTEPRILEVWGRLYGGLADVPDIHVCFAYGTLPQIEQSRPLRSIPGKFRVILASDIYKTSLTPEQCQSVGDSGLRAGDVWDPVSNITATTTNMSTGGTDEAQRFGRAGRVSNDGKPPNVLCFRWKSQEQLQRKAPFVPYRPEGRQSISFVECMKKYNVPDYFIPESHRPTEDHYRRAGDYIQLHDAFLAMMQINPQKLPGSSTEAKSILGLALSHPGYRHQLLGIAAVIANELPRTPMIPAKRKGQYGLPTDGRFTIAHWVLLLYAAGGSSVLGALFSPGNQSDAANALRDSTDPRIMKVHEDRRIWETRMFPNMEEFDELEDGPIPPEIIDEIGQALTIWSGAYREANIELGIPPFTPLFGSSLDGQTCTYDNVDCVRIGSRWTQYVYLEDQDLLDEDRFELPDMVDLRGKMSASVGSRKKGSIPCTVLCEPPMWPVTTPLIVKKPRTLKELGVNLTRAVPSHDFQADFQDGRVVFGSRQVVSSALSEFFADDARHLIGKGGIKGFEDVTNDIKEKSEMLKDAPILAASESPSLSLTDSFIQLCANNAAFNDHSVREGISDFYQSLPQTGSNSKESVANYLSGFIRKLSDRAPISPEFFLEMMELERGFISDRRYPQERDNPGLQHTGWFETFGDDDLGISVLIGHYLFYRVFVLFESIDPKKSRTVIDDVVGEKRYTLNLDFVEGTVTLDKINGEWIVSKMIEYPKAMGTLNDYRGAYSALWGIQERSPLWTLGLKVANMMYGGPCPWFEGSSSGATTTERRKKFENRFPRAFNMCNTLFSIDPFKDQVNKILSLGAGKGLAGTHHIASQFTSNLLNLEGARRLLSFICPGRSGKAMSPSLWEATELALRGQAGAATRVFATDPLLGAGANPDRFKFAGPDYEYNAKTVPEGFCAMGTNCRDTSRCPLKHVYLRCNFGVSCTNRHWCTKYHGSAPLLICKEADVRTYFSQIGGAFPGGKEFQAGPPTQDELRAWSIVRYKRQTQKDVTYKTSWGMKLEKAMSKIKGGLGSGQGVRTQGRNSESEGYFKPPKGKGKGKNKGKGKKGKKGKGKSKELLNNE